MKAWVTGENAAAAKVDPTVGTLIAAVVEILVRFDLHTKLGMSPEDMLTTLLDIAFVALMLRSIQINVSKKNRAANDPPPPSADEPPALDETG